MKKTKNVIVILHVAKAIRNELAEYSCWKFSGTFQTFTPVDQASIMDTYWSRRKHLL